MNAQTQQAGTDYDWTVFSNITQPTNPGAALQAEQPMRRQHWMECVLYSALTLQSGRWMAIYLVSNYCLPHKTPARSLLTNTLFEKTNNMRVLLELLEF